jgi:protein-tyrosine phosphatase
VIDLHSHLLPAIDDGSRTLEQSVVVLREMARRGVTDVALTPHVLAGRMAEGVPPEQDEAFERLKAVTPPGIELHRGAEVMLDRPLAGGQELLLRFTLGGSRYLLVEFPRLVAAQAVQQALVNVVQQGVTPVLAHPERYVCCSPASVRRWKETGALMQVDATTLLSARGRGDRARQLVEAGLADIAAADNHGDDRLIDSVHEALDRQGGAMQADLLVSQNPRAVLDDRPTEMVPPLRLRRSIVQRIRGLLETEE